MDLTNRSGTIVNHAGIDLACSVDSAWAAVLDAYVSGAKFREQGYRLDPLDEPTARHGGYRMVLENAGGIVDERVCAVTERDETARRLSLRADYRSIPGGLVVYATYQVSACPVGAHFSIDCHADFGCLPVGDGAMAAELDALTARSEAGLRDFLVDFKSKLEGSAPSTVRSS